MARSCPRRSAICRARATSRTAFKRLTLLRPERRTTGAGGRARQARGARPGATAGGRGSGGRPQAGRYEAATLAWALPEAVGDRCRPRRGPRPGRGHGAGLVPVRPVQVARPGRSAAAQARAPGDRRRRRRGGNRSTARSMRRGWRPRPRTARASSRACPSNVVTPDATSPTAPARSPTPTTPVSVEVLGRAEIERRGMGGLVAVAKGSAEEPQLIALRYAGGGERRDASGWSARPSPSTPAGSRSSPRRRWRR